MSAENEHVGDGDVADSEETSYQPPPQKTIDQIVAIDPEDESLRRYKETLLGAAQSETIVVGECGKEGFDDVFYKYP